MSEPVDIPPRWRWATFGDVARVASDLVDPTLTPDAIHIAPNHIESGTGKLLPFATVATDKVTSPKHRFHEGQLLYSKIRPYLAKVAKATFCGVCSADMYPIDARIESGFLFHWLLSSWFTAFASRNQGRTVLPKINQDALALLPVPVAPLSEQHRIAEKIDELFSDLDAGIASLQRAKANLKRYRASVLKSAVEGRLTEEWRKEHPQAEDGQMLLDRILRERREKWEKDQLHKFKEKGKEPRKNWESKYEEPSVPDAGELPELPEGWVWATVEQLLHGIEGGTSFQCLPRMATAEEWGVIKVSAMTWGTFLEEEQKALPPETAFDPDTEIQPGDLLLSRCNTVELVGASVLVSDCRPRLLLSDKSLRLLASVCINKQWLHKVMSSRMVRQQMSDVATGSSNSMRNISQEKIKAVRLPLPPLAEQEQIVALVEERLSQIESAEKTIDAELIRSKRLRQSILKRAFEGKLVPQDPKDEPASVLLERINASREADPPKKKAKKATSIKTGRAF